MKEGVVGFIIGATIAAGITYKITSDITKKRLKEKYDKEIESVIETFSGIELNHTEQKEIEEDKIPILETVDETKKSEEVVKKVPTYTKTELEKKAYDEISKVYRQPYASEENKIYEIDISEFNKSGYSKKYIEYNVNNGKFYDEDGNQIGNVYDIFGTDDSIYDKVDNATDDIYVCNESLKETYCISKIVAPI